MHITLQLYLIFLQSLQNFQKVNMNYIKLQNMLTFNLIYCLIISCSLLLFVFVFFLLFFKQKVNVEWVFLLKDAIYGNYRN